MKGSIRVGQARATRRHMWPHTGSVEVEVKEAVGVVKIQAEGQVPVEVAEEMVGAAEVKIVEVKIKATKEAVPKARARDTRGTRWPGTPTCPRSSPASATGNSGSRLIFVWNQSPVHGRIIIFQNQTIDSLTSSTKRLTRNCYILLYIKIKFKKYTRVS